MLSGASRGLDVPRKSRVAMEKDTLLEAGCRRRPAIGYQLMSLDPLATVFARLPPAVSGVGAPMGARESALVERASPTLEVGPSSWRRTGARRLFRHGIFTTGNRSLLNERSPRVNDDDHQC
jgi:hypothetical protein